MKLVSVTICDNREDTIGAMVRSVTEFVDEVIIVDTGITDRTIERAELAAGYWRRSLIDGARVQMAATKVTVIPFPWVNDFSAARNFALDQARAAGANWALMVDSDETIETTFHPYALQQMLSVPSDVPYLALAASDGTYRQPRLFRMPAQGKFVGPTHEEFRVPGYPPERARVLEGVTFSTPKKGAVARLDRAERDLPLLEAYTLEHPEDPRFWYYLGAVYAELEMPMDAVQAFYQRMQLGLGEESAWAAFRGGVEWMKMGKYGVALAMLAEGMHSHAGMPELPWLAGLACLEMGRLEQAIYWSQLATTLGLFEGIGRTIPRVGQKALVAHYEGPFEIIAKACRGLGHVREAEKADITHGIAMKYHAAMVKR